VLANLYFRRFLLAWHNHGHRDQLDAHVVNYADDFVICCRPGNAEAAMTQMARLMARLGLGVNTTKTRIARLHRGTVRLPRLHGRSLPWQRRAPILRHPAVAEGGEELAQAHPRERQWYPDEPASTVARISSMLRGWCGYFDQGPVMEIYELVRAYTERRVRRC
jgi:RNA-directed DNA polymerase